jgi:hypothetical protein
MRPWACISVLLHRLLESQGTASPLGQGSFLLRISPPSAVEGGWRGETETTEEQGGGTGNNVALAFAYLACMLTLPAKATLLPQGVRLRASMVVVSDW